MEQKSAGTLREQPFFSSWQMPMWSSGQLSYWGCCQLNHWLETRIQNWCLPSRRHVAKGRSRSGLWQSCFPSIRRTETWGRSQLGCWQDKWSLNRRLETGIAVRMPARLRTKNSSITKVSLGWYYIVYIGEGQSLFWQLTALCKNGHSKYQNNSLQSD